jgi:hypothetical protein
MISDYRCAVHEAGHAVIGIRLGFVCQWASIRSFTHRGETSMILGVARDGRRIWPKDHARLIFNRLLQGMAGDVAEIEILGYSSRGDICDRYELQKVIRHLCDIPSAEQQLRRLTRDLVRQHRDDIERVAELLEKRKHLSGTHIDAVLGLPRKQQDFHALIRTWEHHRSQRSFPGEPPSQLLLPGID